VKRFRAHSSRRVARTLSRSMSLSVSRSAFRNVSRTATHIVPEPCRRWCHRIETVIVTNRTVRHFVVTACAIAAAWCWLKLTSA
jgi:hypothetical protein